MAIPLFDAHCDTAAAILKHGGGLRKNRYNLDLERYAAYSPRGQVFAIWATPGTADIYDRTMAVLRQELTANADLVALCRNAQEARAAQETGRLAAFLSIEGAEILDCDLYRLHQSYQDGVRIIHLCWNHDNVLTGAAMDSGAGLTARGREFARAAWGLGMLIDLSHISEAAFWEVAELAPGPVIAGHSNARALCDHPRNLTDDQFCAIARSGGVAGLNLWTEFLGLGRDVEAVVAHAEHFLALGGAGSVCLGGDWDGVDDELPAGITGIQDAGKIYEAMLRRNWSEELVRGIFCRNIMRVLEHTR
jgi:membrane dipeptidase